MRREETLKITLYDQAVQIVKKLRNAGYQAYFAGGAVRDQIRGVTPTDYDIATSAKPQEVLSLFPKAIPVGITFGVVLVPLGKWIKKGSREKIEIATFRSDGVYLDGRHPQTVTFSGEKEDALRRDFTVNGMFFDPVENRVIDYVGGREDLKTGIIRSIGEPEIRFKEDFLRIIRAVRFAAQFSFQIEPKTYETIQKMAESVRNVSPERIRDELEKILTGPDPVRGLKLLEESGILKVILPETIQMKENGLLHQTYQCMGFVSRPSFELAMAILLHKAGGPSIVHQICLKFKLSNTQTDKITGLVRELPVFQEIPRMREAALKRFLRVPDMKELLELYHADCLVSGRSLELWKFCIDKLKEFKPEDLAPAILLSGNSLIEMGYAPGPLFKKILNDLEDLQLEGKIKTVEEAKSWVKGSYQRSGN